MTRVGWPMESDLKNMRVPVLFTCTLLALSGVLALMRPAPAAKASAVARHTPVVSDPRIRGAVSFAEAPAEIKKGARGKVVAAAAPAAPPAPSKPASVQSRNLDPYKGLGAWIDQFDFGRADSPAPTQVINELAAHGVKTLFLQTGKWNSSEQIMNLPVQNAYLELAHAQGIQVVGWYLPGFGDMDEDVRRSVAVFRYKSPTGQSYDGFAPDIEERRAVGNSRDRFNSGIVEYSRKLREAVGDAAIGAIVVDAKNNKRAPSYWVGFPWPEIGRDYDVILPMAYWSVTKKAAQCGTTIDVTSYMRELIVETQDQMGQPKPMHFIGGTADCNSVPEMQMFADVTLELHAIGGSLYDYFTQYRNPARDQLWEQLQKLTPLAPPLQKRP